MILTVGATKGGEGKTTIALNIAIARAMAGRRVMLVDGDRQRTAEMAVTNRARMEIEPAIAVANFVDGATLKSQVELQRDTWDDIIIDVGGRDSTSLRAALVVCDRLLVPFRPRSFSIWALTDIAILIDEANSYRAQPLTADAMLNFADPDNRGADNEASIENLEEFSQFRPLGAGLNDRKAFSLGDRKAFANAAGTGMCVHELAPQWANPTASRELDTLIDLLF